LWREDSRQRQITTKPRPGKEYTAKYPTQVKMRAMDRVQGTTINPEYNSKEGITAETSKKKETL